MHGVHSTVSTAAPHRENPTEVHIPAYTQPLDTNAKLGNVLSRFIKKTKMQQQEREEENAELGNVLTDFIKKAKASSTQNGVTNKLEEVQLGLVLNNFNSNNNNINNFHNPNKDSLRRVQLIGPIPVKSTGHNTFSVIKLDQPAKLQTFVIEEENPNSSVRTERKTDFFGTNRPSLDFGNNEDSMITVRKDSEEGFIKLENHWMDNPQKRLGSDGALSPDDFLEALESRRAAVTGLDKDMRQVESVREKKSIPFQAESAEEKQNQPMNIRFDDEKTRLNIRFPEKRR